MWWPSKPVRSRLAEIERREQAVADRFAALEAHVGRTRRLFQAVEQRVSAMVLEAGTIEQLVQAAGRELDPQARVALGEIATTIRSEGRAALTELRQGAASTGPQV